MLRTGVTRPQAVSHAWRSDPGQPMPQSIELRWPSPRCLAAVQLSFAGHRLGLVHHLPAFFRDPQTVRDYRLQVPDSTGWRDLVVQTGNCQIRRHHVLPEPVTTTALRLQIDATNGDPAATVYEIRIEQP